MGSKPDTPVRVEGVRSVAVIGAGVSGILATKYLLQAGLDVTVFERNSSAGGIWRYDDIPALEPSYPAKEPLSTSLDHCPWYSDHERPPGKLDHSVAEHDKWIRSHAPPSPCYAGLTTNFSLLAMELKDHPWPWEIPVPTAEIPDYAAEWAGHKQVLDHLVNAAKKFGLEGLGDKLHYNTLVEKVEKSGEKWHLRASTMMPETSSPQQYSVSTNEWEFDAVVVASGHYNTPRIPEISGLKKWRETVPDRVVHSKSYKRPEVFEKENVLLVGGGTSSTEIAREIGPFANKIYQAGRGTVFDLPVEFLPGNCERITEVVEFGTLAEPSSTAPSTPLGSVKLKDGTEIKDITRVIVCTGYHYNYPFLPDYHAETHKGGNEAASPKLLVTDGTCTLNLHQDMFYIPDPTLTFAGISLFISTFAFYEYQTMAIASVLAGKAQLPSQSEMEAHYAERLEKRGATKFMNARMDEEVSYVDKIVAWLNEAEPGRNLESFSARWHAVRDQGKLEKVRARFAREKREKEMKLGS